ncbi:MAG: methyltransferase [SAR86 cluster bacterium]|uniref:Methyltransferase n=1 Tax=SAR86 cluster bacterium TaxID=2030880 RepID=A0A2A5B020_9GAMM|nr:MAG: methyltransferase [SAR86 cluster bacterium]
MKISVKLLFAYVSALSMCISTLAFADHHNGKDALGLDQLAVAEHRSETNIARNDFRHPVETLEFFGLEPNMTVIEILPSTGWYTEIVAPYVKDHGKFYAAHFSPNASLSYMAPNLRNFEAKITAEPELYGKITVRHLNPPNEVAIAPPESADMALTFRNVHNWIMAGQENEFFATFYTALKPGGILGVVEHRAREDAGMDVMRTSGYVTEAYVIEVATAAGFELVANSEINANSKDLTVYPQGVWTLPPNYRMGDENRARYNTIGESDRMTLKFVKPL